MRTYPFITIVIIPGDGYMYKFVIRDVSSWKSSLSIFMLHHYELWKTTDAAALFPLTRALLIKISGQKWRVPTLVISGSTLRDTWEPVLQSI